MAQKVISIFVLIILCCLMAMNGIYHYEVLSLAFFILSGLLAIWISNFFKIRLIWLLPLGILLLGEIAQFFVYGYTTEFINLIRDMTPGFIFHEITIGLLIVYMVFASIKIPLNIYRKRTQS